MIKSILGAGTTKVFWSFGPGFAVQGLYFIILARLLGASSFGTWSGALALVTAASGLVGLGAGHSVVIWGARDPRRMHEQVGTTLVYIVASGTFVSVILHIALRESPPEFYALLTPLLWSELFTIRLVDLALQIFQGRDRLGRNSLVRILNSCQRLVLVSIFFAGGLHDSVQWAYFYAATVWLGAIVFLAWAVGGRGGISFSKRSLRSTWRNSIFFALGMTARELHLDGDKYVLNQYGLTVDAGHLSAANRVINMAFSPIQSLVYSKNLALFRVGEYDAPEVVRVVKRPFLWILALGVAIGAAVALCAPILVIFLGSEFSASVGMLQALSPLLAVNGIYYLFGDALMGMGKQLVRSSCQLVVAILSIAANFLLVPSYGAWASVWIALGSGVTMAVVVSWAFVNELKQREKPRLIGRHSRQSGLAHFEEKEMASESA